MGREEKSPLPFPKTTPYGKDTHMTHSTYQYELNPEIYEQRQRESRRRTLEETLGGLAILALISIVFAAMQVAYGIW
jgi:hypothetical protein